MAEFTKGMKNTHKILVPDMLPVHFRLIISVMKKYGYNLELLTSDGKEVVEEGLKNVHNDTCYPALLVIGQFLDALKSGRYDPDKTALMITQSGGGCRASNYINLLRKALEKDYPQVPVISLNFAGLEKCDGFKVTFGMLLRLMYAVLYGDLLMLAANQCLPYEKRKGDTERVRSIWEKKLSAYFENGKYKKTKKIYGEILRDFAAIEVCERNKPRVGIVGEIYVKYSPLANNHLEEFLLSEGCEPVVPGLLDFCLYCIINSVNDGKIYGFANLSTRLNKLVYKILYKKQRQLIAAVEKHGVFRAPHDFEVIRKYADKYINQGVKMGEGWLIPAEMAGFAEEGTMNIVCAQPFGCLPNHIVSKGVSRVIKNAYPEANIVAIDYDPSATSVNQENRIKLMLANIDRDKKAV